MIRLFAYEPFASDHYYFTLPEQLPGRRLVSHKKTRAWQAKMRKEKASTKNNSEQTS